MKLILAFFFLILCFDSRSQNHSDLYDHIDSLIKYEIQYVYDSTTDKLPVNKWDSTKNYTAHFSTFPSNPSPIIILDGNKIDREELDNFKLKRVSNIDVHPKNSKMVTALYGTSGSNGAVIIQTKRFVRKKK